ncbi:MULTISPECIES: DUF2199 domain-containing protein [Micromonospora]|uniref:DUF2199 domain-containing protein n=1 Tax=Micromonospora solifontis TaxID=2487138 RepID=A0ABX9WDN9_9ACTN|nr:MULTISPECIES: DUF2199 domain-containing protein [Micromonospora]NES16186.1 DUF2199 domain-containing protein [Micromonospora sp. PPF5-17B]NES38013.1 DUF2199 domain-containing protein [Micromonospora solifontis]NES57673.1 DUF2199 domain-containing protein [Micromonospora sp. PPF5-6]RNL97692.1 DUF2199 domain-containing protein [Micromonospora solifontis]
MHDDLGYNCGTCGARHEEAPLSYRTHAPVYWSDELAMDGDSELTPDLCVIRGEHFFVQGNLDIPLRDAEGHFSWGVWVSLSGANFARMLARWDTPGREAETPYFGWLSTELPVYEPTTVNLKTHVHTQPVGLRPHIEVEPTDHPLAVAQRTGMTMTEVRRIAERLLHPEPLPGSTG